MPDMGGLDSSKGWCPRKQNGKKYSFNITRFNDVKSKTPYYPCK